MINGELIRRKRKELKMSQGELAEGITSQGKISQIETCSSIPSGETLEKIVTRLNLSFAETIQIKEYVDPDEIIQDVNLRLIHQQFESAQKILKKITADTYLTEQQQLWYDFVQAFIFAHQGGTQSDMIFTYNRFLQGDQGKLGILLPLVFSELGIEYLYANKAGPAQYYIDAAQDAFKGYSPRKYQYAALQVWSNASYFYLVTKQYKKAIKFARSGIELAQQALIYGPVDKLYSNLAFALAGKNGKWNSDSIRALYVAYIFSDRINDQAVRQVVSDALNQQGITIFD